MTLEPGKKARIVETKAKRRERKKTKKLEKAKSKLKSLCSEDTYRKWVKLGQDPDKFRKLFPDCSTSRIENKIDTEVGKDLFNFIVYHFERIINQVIITLVTK